MWGDTELAFKMSIEHNLNYQGSGAFLEKS